MKQFQNVRVVLIMVLCFSVYAQEPLEKSALDYGKKLMAEQFYSLAAAQFQDYLEQFPYSPGTGDALYFLGMSLIQSGKYQDAQNAFLRFVIGFPADERCDEGHFRIAECFEKMNDYESAVTAYLRVISYFPDHELSYEALFRAASLAGRNHDNEQAVSICKRLQTYKLSYDLYSRSQFLLADLYIQNTRFEEASEILTALAGTGIRNEDKINAGIKLAGIQYHLGYDHKARQLFQQILQSNPDETVRQQALLGLAYAEKRTGRKDEAINALQQIVSASVIHVPGTEVILFLGNLLVEEHRPEAAVSAYLNAIENHRVETTPELMSGLAYAYYKAGDTVNCIAQCRELMVTEPIDIRIKKKTLLLLAQTGTNHNGEGLHWIEMYIQTFPSDPLNIYLKMRQAEIYLTSGLSQQGWNLLRQIWEMVPESEHAVKAYSLYYNDLKKRGYSREAAKVRDIIASKYPGANITALKSFKSYSDHPGPQAFVKLHTLMSQILQTPEDPEPAYQYARFLIDPLQMYANAIPYLRTCYSAEPYKIKSGYLLASVYEHLYAETQDVSYRDSADTYFKISIASGTIDDTDQKVVSDYLEFRFNTEESPEKTMLEYLNLTSPMPLKNRLRMILGDYYLRQNSLASAEKQFLAWIHSGVDSGLARPRFSIAAISIQRKQFEKADSLFKIIEKDMPDNHWNPVILYNRGIIASVKGQDSEARISYQKIIDEYPYSTYADSAGMQLGGIYLRNRNYQAAVNIYKALFEEDSVRHIAFVFGLIQNKPAVNPQLLPMLARAYEGLGAYLKAERLFLRTHDILTDAERIPLYMHLARLAEEQNNPERAIDYLQALIQDDSPDTLYQWIGSLYEQQGDFQSAYAGYQDAIKKVQPEKKALFNHRLILCLLQQNKIPEAEARINVFEKSFQKEPEYDHYMAEIWLEKGKAQFRNKNFVQAEELFRRVRDKYKKTRFRSSAQLEIGRTYIITNKIDDALDVLTKMAEEYREDPVYYRVYLNLGDLYFRQQQLDNALSAFKIVLKDSLNSENQQLASRYLIRIYETMGLWEAALALTRNYIQQYPEAEDLVLKKVQIGSFYMRLRDYSRAVDQFRRVQIEADSETEAEIQYWTGKCYAEMGQFERAILEYLKVKYISKPTKLPWASTAMYEAAMVYLKLYKPWEAKVIFEKIVRYEGAASDLGRVAKQRIVEIEEGKYAEMQ